MRATFLCLCLFLTIGHAQLPNAFRTPIDGFKVTAGKSFELSWTNQTKGSISIYLVPFTQGFPDPFSAAISLGIDGIKNTGSATAHIPRNVSTTREYVFEIFDPSEYDHNSATDTPSKKPSTNESRAFTILPGKKPKKPVNAIVGGAVGGFIGLLLIVFVIWLYYTRDIRRKHKETADTEWFPKPHRDMAQRRNQGDNIEAPRTPTKALSSTTTTSSTTTHRSPLDGSPTSVTDMTENTSSRRGPPVPWVLDRSMDHEIGHDADH